MKKDTAAPLLSFTRRLIEEVSQVWSWGPPGKEKKRMHNILDAIVFIKSHDLCQAGFIGAYHARRVALLMARTLSLYGMTPGA